MSRPVEYTHRGARWRCDRWDEFRADHPKVASTELSAWQAWVAQDPRLELVARRLYGLRPVLPPPGSDPDDFVAWSPAALAEALGITGPQLRQEVEALRGLTSAWLARPEDAAPSPALAALDAPRAPGPAAEESDDDLLLRHGFSPSHFMLEGRAESESLVERAWFAGRLRVMGRFLGHAVAGEVVRRVLLKELDLRRVETAMSGLRFGTKEYLASRKVAVEIESEYVKLQKQMEERLPETAEASRQIGLQGVVTDLIRSMQEYKARGDSALADGIFTATGIAIELRRSVQVPVVRYRAGLVAWLSAARAGLWDAKWDGSALGGKLLAKMDKAFAAAFAAESDAANDTLPDLQADGPAGEYEDPVAPAPGGVV